MKKRKYTLAALLLSTTLSLHASHYTIQYKGVTLGEINDISTVKSLYLKAKVTNFLAKLLLRHKYFVFYSGTKPQIKDAKYRKDKNNVLFALNEAIKQRPEHKEYPSERGKKLLLECSNDICHYTFYKKSKITGKGKITFDKNGEFYELIEEKNGVVIRRK